MTQAGKAVSAAGAAIVLMAAMASAARADNAQGITATAIKIGNLGPFSGESAVFVHLAETVLPEYAANTLMLGASVVIGVLILGVLTNGLTQLEINSYIQQVLTGAIIVLAVTLSSISRRGR